MIPLYVMLGTIAVARGFGALGWSLLDDWQTATRVGLAVILAICSEADAFVAASLTPSCPTMAASLSCSDAQSKVGK